MVVSRRERVMFDSQLNQAIEALKERDFDKVIDMAEELMSKARNTTDNLAVYAVTMAATLKEESTIDTVLMLAARGQD